jgi:hypothetical protein
MKQCPTCNRIFADETLIYCLDDGSLLSSTYDPQATQIITPPRPTEPTLTLASNPYTPPAQPTRQGINPMVVYVLIAVLALVVGGGVIALLKPGAKEVTQSPPSTPTPKQESATAINDEPVTKNQAKQDTGKLPSPTPTPVETPRPSATPRPTNATDSYPKQDSRSGGESDLAYKSCFELKVMRNEIFARHGYIFKTEDMRNYFSRQSWYRPMYADVSGQLSAVEKRNAQLIKQYENRKGCN